MSSPKPSGSRKRSSRLSAKFHEFIETHSPTDVNRHIRGIFLDFVSRHADSGLPPDFGAYVWELQDLFELLDLAADEAPLLEKSLINKEL